MLLWLYIVVYPLFLIAYLQANILKEKGLNLISKLSEMVK